MFGAGRSLLPLPQLPDHLVPQLRSHFIQRLDRLGNGEAEDQRMKFLDSEGLESVGTHAGMLSFFPCIASGFYDEGGVANGRFQRLQ